MINCPQCGTKLYLKGRASALLREVAHLDATRQLGALGGDAAT